MVQAEDWGTGSLLFALTMPETAIAFATVACCLAHCIQGDFNLLTPTEVEALMPGDSSGRVTVGESLIKGTGRIDPEPGAGTGV